MDDFLEQTAIPHKQGLSVVLYILSWMVVVALGLIAVLGISSFIGADPETGSISFNFPALIIALVTGAGAFFAYRLKDRFRVEYDYAFTNGTLDISMVMNNRRRRYLCELSMKEVVRCGPATGPDFTKTLNEPGIKRHNWFVNREAKLYYFYFQKKGVKHVAVMELSDEMISVIRSKKYLQMGVWHDADGKSSYASLS